MNSVDAMDPGDGVERGQANGADAGRMTPGQVDLASAADGLLAGGGHHALLRLSRAATDIGLAHVQSEVAAACAGALAGHGVTRGDVDCGIGHALRVGGGRAATGYAAALLAAAATGAHCGDVLGRFVGAVARTARDSGGIANNAYTPVVDAVNAMAGIRIGRALVMALGAEPPPTAAELARRGLVAKIRGWAAEYRARSKRAKAEGDLANAERWRIHCDALTRNADAMEAGAAEPERAGG